MKAKSSSSKGGKSAAGQIVKNIRRAIGKSQSKNVATPATPISPAPHSAQRCACGWKDQQCKQS